MHTLLRDLADHPDGLDADSLNARELRQALNAGLVVTFGSWACEYAKLSAKGRQMMGLPPEPSFLETTVGPALQWLADARSVVYPFLGSRLMLLVIGLLTHILIQPVAIASNALRFTDHPAWNIWGAWDAQWYVNLASTGYAAEPNADGWVNWAFFPAYPAISHAIAQFFHAPTFAVMVAVSNLCFLAALFLVRRLARLEFDSRSADLTVALLCAAPGSYFFSCAYTESLFLLALTGCLLLLRRQAWIAAGAAGSLAILTRNVGVGLLLPFVTLAGPRLLDLATDVKRRVGGAKGRLAVEALRVASGLALPLLALLGFAVFLYLKTGDPVAFMTAQKGWGRSVGSPLKDVTTFLVTPAAIQSRDLINIAAAGLALWLLTALLLMRKWPLFALAAFLTLVPLSAGVGSFARFFLVILPLFMVGARLLADRPAATTTTLIVLSSVNGFMMVAWTLALASAV